MYINIIFFWTYYIKPHTHPKSNLYFMCSFICVFVSNYSHICEFGLAMHTIRGDECLPQTKREYSCVTLRWQADVYNNVNIFEQLSSPWRRTYRSAQIPARQFVQPAHRKWRNKFHVRHADTFRGFYTTIYRVETGQTQTHTHILMDVEQWLSNFWRVLHQKI